VISGVFIQRPKLAMVVGLVITFTGLLAMKLLPISEYPEVAPPQISVSASWPGASAAIMEESVGQVIEDVVNGVEGMEYMSSSSSNNGSYSLAITFEVGEDPDMALVRVQNSPRPGPDHRQALPGHSLHHQPVFPGRLTG